MSRHTGRLKMSLTSPSWMCPNTWSFGLTTFATCSRRSSQPAILKRMGDNYIIFVPDNLQRSTTCPASPTRAEVSNTKRGAVGDQHFRVPRDLYPPGEHQKRGTSSMLAKMSRKRSMSKKLKKDRPTCPSVVLLVVDRMRIERSLAARATQRSSHPAPLTGL